MGNTSSRNEVYDKYYSALKKKEKLGQPMDMSDVDPYEVLGVRKNFEWDELKNSYKRLAKLVHPDKGGSEILFNTVTDCFRKLAHEYKGREEKNHNQLRDGSLDFYKQFQPPPENTSSRDGKKNSSKGKSNSNGKYESRDDGASAYDLRDKASFMERFNRAFEDNRLDDEDGNSVGYGDKMAASSKVREDFSIPRVMKKYDPHAFNRVFDAVTLPETTEIVKYVEPEPLPLAKSIQYTELGKANTGDFSSTSEGEGRRTLQYTDYMKAYTTTRLVDPRAVEERTSYRNVKEYDAARSDAVNRPVTNEEAAWREQRQYDMEKRELDRLSRLKERDNRQALHFEKVNRLVLR